MPVKLYVWNDRRKHYNNPVTMKGSIDVSATDYRSPYQTIDAIWQLGDDINIYVERRPREEIKLREKTERRLKRKKKARA